MFIIFMKSKFFYFIDVTKLKNKKINNIIAWTHLEPILGLKTISQIHFKLVYFYLKLDLLRVENGLGIRKNPPPCHPYFLAHHPLFMYIYKLGSVLCKDYTNVMIILLFTRIMKFFILLYYYAIVNQNHTRE